MLSYIFYQQKQLSHQVLSFRMRENLNLNKLTREPTKSNWQGSVKKLPHSKSTTYKYASSMSLYTASKLGCCKNFQNRERGLAGYCYSPGM